MISRIWRLRIQLAALARADSGPLEVAVGAYLFAWGATLLAPGDAFSTGRGYRVMAAIAPEEWWGFVSTGVGGWAIMAYLIGSMSCRAGGCLLSATVSAMMAAGVLTANPQLASGWCDVVITLASLGSCYLLRRQGPRLWI